MPKDEPRLVKAAEKPAAAPKAAKMGRRVASQSDRRSARLVMLVHPDLAALLKERSRHVGLSTSALAERMLINCLNNFEGGSLDNIGRKREDISRLPTAYP